MRSEVRRKMDMAVSVRDFSRAYPTTDPGHQAAVARYEELVAFAEELLGRQRDGQLVAQASRGRRRMIRRELTDRLLRHLVSVAELAGTKDPDGFGAFRLPAGNGSHLAFTTALRSMLDVAKARSEDFAKHGLGTTVMADFERAVADFEQLNGSVHEATRSHVGATSDLPRLMGEIARMVGVLDGINRYRFAGNSEVLAAWNSARNVANPVKGKDHGPSTTPAANIPISSGEVPEAA